MNRTSLLVTFLAAVALPSCMWTEFDDLKDDVWVDSVQATDDADSARFGDNLMEARGPADAGAGAVFAVIGSNQASLSVVRYDADGVRTTETAPDFAETLYALGVLGENPAIAADPLSDRVAMTLLSDVDPNSAAANTKIILADGASVGTAVAIEPLPTDPAVRAGLLARGLAFVPPPYVLGDSDAAVTDRSAKLVAGREGQLLLVNGMAASLGATPTMRYCDAETGGGVGGVRVYAVAAANVIGTAETDIIVASGAPSDTGTVTGTVWVLDGATVGTAFGADPTVDCDALDLAPRVANVALGLGSQIMVADLGAGERVVVSTPGTSGAVSVLDFTLAPALERTIAAPGLDAFDIGELDASNAGLELVIGLPLANIEGTENAGEVRVVSAAGVDLGSLTNARPTTQQKFGKSVAIVPWTGDGLTNVLVVGADDRVYTYFRSPFYADDVRANR